MSVFSRGLLTCIALTMASMCVIWLRAGTICRTSESKVMQPTASCWRSSR